jgi:putative membrane protein
MVESCLLRDDLAWRRTALANERTLLAYARTALALMAAGATVIKFFEGLPWTLAGISMCMAGVLAGLTGARRYDRVRRDLMKDAPGYHKN